MLTSIPKIDVKCYHCGDICPDNSIRVDEKIFCCDGCKTVHELLAENNLCTYYELENNPGISAKAKPFKNKFAYLDDPHVQQQLIAFSDDKITRVNFNLPQIHCASCVWLLEHLYKLNPGITYSRVDFVQKQIAIQYDKKRTTLRKTVETLAMVGYEPALNLSDLDGKQIKKTDRSRIYKLTVAGFGFANIMMLSFPEYLGLGSTEDVAMQRLFSYLNIALALPALLYSASEFFVSSWQGIRARFLNIDLPIALAIAVTFIRSIYEIFWGSGAGYLDSMTGIIFFMLVGRYFQDKTHAAISFDRDYKSFFPVSVTVHRHQQEETISISALKPGDIVVIRSGEIIPADAVLLQGKAAIDYSFVNGESMAIPIQAGEMIYAGGRQTAGTIRVEIKKPVAQSYLTQLWNKEVFQSEKKEHTSSIHLISKYFTYIVFAIAAITFAVWYPHSPAKGLDAVTAILIIACPCALLLSATYTNGNVLRILARNHFYLKNASVIETLAKARHLVFDKTGTITRSRLKEVVFNGFLSDEEEEMVVSVAAQSGHPLSRSIAQAIPCSETYNFDHYREITGEGIEATVQQGPRITMGSRVFVEGVGETGPADSRVWVAINGQVKGYYSFKTEYREHLKETLDELHKGGNSLAMISGDHETETERLTELFGHEATLKFKQSPEEKLQYIAQLQSQHNKVVMIGDGLNDAGALRQSDVGIAVSDDANNFSPACDAILKAQYFNTLPQLLHFTRDAQAVIMGSFILSIVYNVIGLWFATQAELRPVIAAILMPASSISIILFTTGVSWLYAKKRNLQ